ncbi:MAG TPA: PBP1A family penicillin-binding protein [Gammaproteobacteria bacterium]|nr:PBP1A family penicillin-binding protein [Gammaproteobacteria bacterium]
MHLFRSSLFRASCSFVSFFSVVVLAFLLFILSLYVSLPNVEALQHVQLQVPLHIESSDGRLMAEFGEKKRIPVKLKDIPVKLVEGVLATEDQRYFDHLGVDFKGLVRAAQEVLHARRKVQGASTITMQVARNFFLTPEKTYVRKINEILLAFQIESHLSKAKILELYLNKIYLGKRAYGVRAAARNYYGKQLKDLTLAEMAMIAGLPQSPSRNNPIDNPVAAVKRRNYVLYRMYKKGSISLKNFKEATNEPNTAKRYGAKIELKAGYVSELIRQGLMKIYGSETYTRGFTVKSTVLSPLQQQAKYSLQKGLQEYSNNIAYYHPHERSIKGSPETEWAGLLKKTNHYLQVVPAVVVSFSDKGAEIMLEDESHHFISMEQLQSLRFEEAVSSASVLSGIFKYGDVVYVRPYNNVWALTQLPSVQGAIVSVDSSGGVLAMQGGFSYSRSAFNRAVQAWRQPGSLLKPFIFASALVKGYTLSSTINDAPIVTKGSGENLLWRPGNDDRTFQGMVTLRDALVKSRNLVSIRLLDYLGIDFVIDYLSLFGFSSSQMPRSLSLALGSGLSTPLQVANGFAVFANQGQYRPAHLVEALYDQEGNEVKTKDNIELFPGVWLFDPKINRPVVSPEVSYLINDVLKDVIQRGTGRRAKVLKRKDLFGKTGTTNDKIDAWFSGFMPGITTTVWVGFDQATSLRQYGSQIALPIWVNFMRKAISVLPVTDLEVPEDILSARVYDSKGNPYFELFTSKQFELIQKRQSSLEDAGAGI